MMENIRDVCADNISELMRNNGTKQKQLAEAIGIDPSAVSRRLSKERKEFFTIEQIAAIADYYKVSIDELFGRKPSAHSFSDYSDVVFFLFDLLDEGLLRYDGNNGFYSKDGGILRPMRELNALKQLPLPAFDKQRTIDTWKVGTKERLKGARWDYSFRDVNEAHFD